MSRSIVNRATCAFNRAISACSGVIVGTVALPSDVIANWPYASARTQFVRLASGMPSVLERLPTQLNSRIDELLPHNWRPAN